MRKYILIIFFCLIILSCGTKKSINQPKISDYRVDSIVYDSSITYTLYINDTVKYIKEFQNNGNPIFECFMINDKLEGDNIIYKNGYVIQKNLMKSNILVSSCNYYWTGTRLDSALICRCLYNLDSNKCNGDLLGTIRYKNGKADLENSDYYTVDLIYPVTKTYGPPGVVINVPIGNLGVVRQIQGVLDSNNYKLSLSYDTSYFSASGRKVMIFGCPYNIETFVLYEGIIEIWEDLPDNPKARTLRKRYPFYLPLYLTNKKIEWYFGNRYYSVN